MRARLPLRVGVVVDAAEPPTLPAWQHGALWELVHGQDGALAVVVVVADAPPPRVRGLTFRAYRELDRRLFGSPRDPMAPIEAGPLLAGRPRIDARAVACPGGYHLPPDALRALRAQQLDALWHLGTGPLAGEVLDCARLGLWSLDHDDDARQGIPPFYAAFQSGGAVLETRLLARSAAGERVLYRSYASTNRNSLARNGAAVLWKSAEFPGRALRGFASGRTPPFDGGPTPCPGPPHAKVQRPRARDVVRFALSATTRVARNRRRLRREDSVWFLALRRRHQEASITEGCLEGFEPLAHPPDRFQADPMIVRVGDAHHLFFEDADLASGLGAIGWRAIHADGSVGPTRIVLAADHHLSYPHVFSWRGDFYMIPETAEKRTVEIYRALEFPLRWQLEKVLFRDVAAVDSTVLEHAGRLWLFTAMSPSGGSLNDELFLFHADSPLGDWTPHPRNPIVSDVRRARPAGPLFHEGGRLWRPGQDCAPYYGAAFWLSRVDVLDEHEYREIPVRRVDPSWTPGGVCTHTYARGGEFEVLDGLTWQPR